MAEQPPTSATPAATPEAAPRAGGATRRADPPFQLDPSRAVRDQGVTREAGRPALDPDRVSSPPDLGGQDLDSRLRDLGHQRAGVDGARYELRGLAGVGGTSCVYAMIDRNLGREVAVKLLERSRPGDRENVESFIDEARITASLQHPNVLPVYDIEATRDGRLYFSMKKIEGRSLGRALEAYSLGEQVEQLATPNAVVSVFIGVCQALSYAHHRGFVHQDVKPDNIMLGDFGEVLLVDWGSAIRATEGAPPKLYGTPLYMSPEQARLEGVSALSDVYCVGASLFHALMRRLPTWADGGEELMARKRRGEIDMPTVEERKRVPAPLLGIALKAMVPEPSARYSSVEAMLRDLKAFQAGLAVSAHRDSPWQLLSRWYRHNRKPFWIAAAGACAVVALIGVFAMEKSKERSSWMPVADEDFAHATLAGLETRWRGLAKSADAFGLPFSEIPLSTGMRWTLSGGRMHLASEREYVDLVWREELHGDFRVEWDYTCERANQNLNCFIGPDREKGFTFHVGAYGDPHYALMTKGAYFKVVDQRFIVHPLVIAKPYHYVMEKDGRHMRMSIDGAMVFDYQDFDAFNSETTSTFGFDCYAGNAQSIEHVRVFDRPLPQRISPLEVGRRLYQAGKVDEAVRQYHEIERSYPGTVLAGSACYERALSTLRSVDKAQGLAQLLAYEAEHPAHEMVPVSLYERLLAARAAASSKEPPPGAAADVDRLRAALRTYRGHPVLNAVLTDMAADRLPSIAWHETTEVGGHNYPDDAIERISATNAELSRMADTYGIPLHNDPFMDKAAPLLTRLGRADLVLADYPHSDRVCARALMAMGRYDEAIARAPYDLVVRMDSMLFQGRYQEVADDPYGSWRIPIALVELGDQARLRARFPDYDLDDRLLAEGKYDEFLARHAESENDATRNQAFQTPRYRVLAARHSYQDILDRYPDAGCQIDAMLGLRRHDELVARVPGDAIAMYRVAFRWLAEGQEIKARGLLARLADAQPDADSTDWMPHFLVQPLMPMLLGRRSGTEAAKALAPVLERHRWSCNQRVWHLAALVTGRIDERQFALQPCRHYTGWLLQFGIALREDCLGHDAAAKAAYDLANASMGGRFPAVYHEFIAWRLSALAPASIQP